MDISTLSEMTSTEMRKHGYGLKAVFNNKEWCLDSLTYLKHNDAVIGILQNGTYTPKEAWDDLVVLEDAQVVYKMWKPFEDILESNMPFHILRDDTDWNKYKTRFEFEPTSCWKASKVSYKGRKKAIKNVIHGWMPCKSVLMSSRDEFILCRPTKKGWQSKPLMQYDTLLPREKSIRINNVLIHLIKEHEEQNNIDMYYQYMAHFNYTMALRLGVDVPDELFSELTEEEENILQSYEKNMLDTYNVSERQTGQAFEERRHFVKQSTQNT